MCVRGGNERLAEQFRARSLGSGVTAGLLAVVGIWIVSADAPVLAGGLRGRGLSLVALSGIGGVITLWLVWRRRSLRRGPSGRGRCGDRCALGMGRSAVPLHAARLAHHR